MIGTDFVTTTKEISVYNNNNNIGNHFLIAFKVNNITERLKKTKDNY